MFYKLFAFFCFLFLHVRMKTKCFVWCLFSLFQSVRSWVIVSTRLDYLPSKLSSRHLTQQNSAKSKLLTKCHNRNPAKSELPHRLIQNVNKPDRFEQAGVEYILCDVIVCDLFIWHISEVFQDLARFFQDLLNNSLGLYHKRVCGSWVCGSWVCGSWEF